MPRSLIAPFLIFLATTIQASDSKLELNCNLIPLDYPGFNLEDIQDKTVKLSAADTSAKPLFSKNNHTFIIGVNRTDITDQPVILDFYLQIQPPTPAAPVRAYSASYFSPGNGKHHARLELLHYADKAEPYPSGQLVFECWQFE